MNRIRNYKKSASKRRRARNSGAVIIETAMIFVLVILPLTLAIIQFGLFYGAKNALGQISRDGSRYAAVYGLASNVSDEAIIDHIKRMADNSAANDLVRSDITITPARASRGQYSLMTVTIRYDLNKKSFLGWAGRIFRPGVITRSATTMVE